MQKCKIIQAFGWEQLERVINAWIATGNRPGNNRFVFNISYQKDGVFDIALIIYEDTED